ncbi:LysR substrate-binding domain-containing protein [Caballeronia sp. SEWSISQ10-4 2]|uniref:LysR substrate-binding domain-containing protein n=1 Tax=Caballeronia sp. SEWSISQ10-4 2 TaxID=2937438 RepID=UPI00265121B6|nr:LysR substrate-binding domain-containing protein [Caballeronia sp. SEWSISQ10-4 2]MDN7179615.1 LysR substrate-binding domain-containing protein [Caballeronia sp. SEWSISQ10-4 2]
MNQKQIEAFRLVMLRGSMTAAAEELGTSQPSISRLIGELEASTGLALFTRNGGRIQATDAGSAFYREVDRSFVGLEKLAHSAREIRQFGSGRLRLVAAPVLALSFVPLVIERFLAAYPRIAVSLEMRSEGTIQRWASSAYCDVGFATTTPDAFGVTSAELYRLAGVCALPAKHPLTARERIHARDLRDQSLILPSYADDTRSSLDRALRQAGATQMPTIETPYGATICAMVARGLGVGVVNPLATSDTNPSRIVFRPFSPDVMFRGFTVCPQLQHPNPLVKAFLDLTNETMAIEAARLRGLPSIV